MRAITLVRLGFAAVCAATALLATSASASAALFRAETYPVKELSTNTNIHGFSIAAGAVVSLCKHATFNTGEEGAPNPTAASETITVHPTYTECFITIPAGNSAATVTTTGCNYILKAKEANTPGAEVKIVCETGKTIEVTDNSIPTCKTKVGAQSLTGAEYRNLAGPPKKVEVGSEVEKIKWKTEGCGVASSGEDGQYREGELVGGAIAKLAEPGHPAIVLTEGKNAETLATDGVEVS